MTRHDLSRFWYPPITSISSTVGNFFFAGSAVEAVDPAAAAVAVVLVLVAAVDPAAVAGFLGDIVMVAPLFTWPPEALLMEKSVGGGVGETPGDCVDGEEVGVQFGGLRVLSGDWLLVSDELTVMVWLDGLSRDVGEQAR